MSLLSAQENILAPLLKAANQERLHSCYVFEGPQGVGKKQAAFLVARAAACESEDVESRPCEKCPTCHHMRKGTHPDLIEVGPDEGKKTRVIGVQSARELVRQTRMHRYSARRRTFVIDPADALNEKAANALLKTLEEPPNGTGFILVTDKASTLLSTVLSRSQRVRFRLSSEEHLRELLSDRGIDNPDRIARWADGRAGRAFELADGEMAELDAARAELLRILAGNSSDLFAFSESLTKNNKKGRVGWQPTVERYLEVIESLLRDAACLAMSPNSLLNEDMESLVSAWSQALYPSGIVRMQQELEKTRRRMALNVNARLLMEPLLAQLAMELGKARSAT